jgi:hypothetical protein
LRVLQNPRLVAHRESRIVQIDTRKQIDKYRENLMLAGADSTAKAVTAEVGFGWI